MVYTNIEGPFPCRQDVLTIYVTNNANHTSTELHKICGNKRWNLITHDDQHFHAVFTTDGSVSTRGFLIRYYETEGRAACDASLVATSTGKIFTSPGYPNTYLPTQSCTWNITTEQQNQVILLFTKDSELQGSTSRRVCDTDYVTVYNGQYSYDEIGTFCGHQQPVFSSWGNSLRVHLQTDDRNSYKGFKMLYKAVPATTCILTMPAGRSPIQFVSPGYPNGYQSGLDCQWTINVPYGSTITVQVLFLDMERRPSCKNDYLLFKDGNTTNAPTLAKICRNTSTPITNSGNHMIISFHSDMSVTGRGFRLQYSAGPVCGLSNLSASLTEKTLTSPGYPSYYYNNLNCTWTISAPVGYKISVDIVDLSMEQSCVNDYLLFTGGSSYNKVQLGKYCGTTTMDVVSSSNYMAITFHTDGSIRGRGFNLKYKAESHNVFSCERSRLNASTSMPGYLTSPGYPNNYKNNVACIWTIAAAVGYKIKVEILYLSVQYSTLCTHDYLLFSDGSSSDAPPLAKYCDTTITHVASSSNYMTITFHSDSSVTGRGFSLKYIATSGCGYVQQIDSSETKMIESPNYPLNYPTNLNCEWTISTDVDGHVIHVRAMHFNLQSSFHCTSDYVQLYEVTGTSEYLLGQWCGTDGPDTQSTTQSMKVRFLSDGAWSQNGFQLAFTSTAVKPTSAAFSDSKVGGIIGGVLGGIAVVVLATCCCCVICKRNKSTSNDQSQRNRTRDVNLNIVFSIPLSNCPATETSTPAVMFTNTPPPAYNEVTKDDPPPYRQIVSQSHRQTFETSSPSDAPDCVAIDNSADLNSGTFE
ncbi:deleted in malignant brain tumors 1 protein-like isoform X2 [Haliotis rufescens]|nr:deleted in malignant brain tumors 1 protein-like isoform X2 [Haliotis rufescens]